MRTNTVFGHLALKFHTQPENIATEALVFILQNSIAASRAFTEFIRLAGIDCPEDLRYETQQVGVDQSIPDMKCRDKEGRLRVVVENKFWAGLTENQPVTYIRELPTSVAGVVLFVVPEARIRILWDVLLSQCRAAGISVNNVKQHTNMTIGALDGEHYVAISSWGSLLRTLAAATTSAGEIDCHNDIAQLRGLCNRMDEEAFLPLRGDELTNLEMARRIINYSDLPFDIAGEAARRGYCSRKGLRETPFRYGSGTYIRIGPYNPWLGFEASFWSTFGVSPLWVVFYPTDPTAEIMEKLSRFRSATPQRCFDLEGEVLVPIFLRIGVEKHLIVEDAVRQIGELANELGPMPQSELSGVDLSGAVTSRFS
jgi:hypothetical protein